MAKEQPFTHIRLFRTSTSTSTNHPTSINNSAIPSPSPNPINTSTSTSRVPTMMLNKPHVQARIVLICYIW
jgi:hypothetical protein